MDHSVQEWKPVPYDREFNKLTLIHATPHPQKNSYIYREIMNLILAAQLNKLFIFGSLTYAYFS